MCPLLQNLLLCVALTARCAVGGVGGSTGPMPPALSWHGIYDTAVAGSKYVVDQPAGLHVRLPGGTELRRAMKCTDTGLETHIFAIDNTTLVVAGCFTTCPLFSQRCSWDDYTTEPPVGGKQPWNRGMALRSTDAGLSWALLAPHVPDLLVSGGHMVHVPAHPATSRAGLHCLLGGFPTQDDVPMSTLPLPVDVVTCTHDGGAWHRQAPLPSPRGHFTAAVHTLPGEAAPRAFLFGGACAEGVRGPGVPELCPDWLLMSDPVPGLDASTGLALAGWTAVGTFPAALRARHMAMVGVWPGVAHSGGGSGGGGGLPLALAPPDEDFALGDAPALLVGYGHDVSTLERVEWVEDFYTVTDPRNASSWVPLPTTAFDSPLVGDIKVGTHIPLVPLQGNFVGSSLAAVRGRSTTHMAAFMPRGPTFVLNQVTAQFSAVRYVSASAVDVAQSGDSDVPPFPAGPVTGAVVLQDVEDRPFVVALFNHAVMRAMTKRCDHTCGSGAYASRCGVDASSPLCIPCSVCTGGGGGEPSPTRLLARCVTAPFRLGNKDTACTACSLCSDDNTTVHACTPTVDTVCGPRASLPLYLPTSARVQLVHEAALQAVLVLCASAAALAVLLAGWGYCCASARPPSSGGKQASARSTAPSPPVLLPPHAASASEAAAYFSARQSSIAREQRVSAASWIASLVLHACDVTLVATTHCSLVAYALSVLSPDEPTVAGVDRGTHASFLGYGLALLVLVSVNAAVVGGRATWLLRAHRLSLESVHVTAWLRKGSNRVWLLAASLCVPMHSRLLHWVGPAAPLRFPLPPRLLAALALVTHSSLLLFDVPVLLTLALSLRASRFPVSVWLQRGFLPPVARTTLAVVVANGLSSVARLAWDVTVCVRGGGAFRLRIALAALPAWRWLLQLLLPRSASLNDADADAEVVPVMPHPGAVVKVESADDEAPAEAVGYGHGARLPHVQGQFVDDALPPGLVRITGVPTVVQWRSVPEGGSSRGSHGVAGEDVARRVRVGSLAVPPRQPLLMASSAGRLHAGGVCSTPTSVGGDAGDEELLMQSVVSPLVAYAAAARAAQRGAASTTSAPASAAGSDASQESCYGGGGGVGAGGWHAQGRGVYAPAGRSRLSSLES